MELYHMSVSYVGIYSNAVPKFKLLAVMSLDKQVYTHAPDIGRPGVLQVRQAMKRRALDTAEEPQQVMSQQLEAEVGT